MVSLTLVVSAFLVVATANAQIPGRAFPVRAVQFAQDLFQTLNPNIVWDPTNFLVDLSGPYTTCSKQAQNGFFQVVEKTKQGGTIGGLVDNTASSGTWAEAAAADIRTVLPTWINRAPFRGQIKNAKRFGCSVSPACNGRTVIGCLFSPAFNGDRQEGDEPKNKQNALAFTASQYAIAQKLTGRKWDNSHFLENLSGFETDCAMINARDWPFNKANFEAARRNMKISPLYGSRPASSNIDNDIGAILTTFKSVPAKKVGCSVIVACKGPGGRPYRVVSCIYEE